MANPTVNKYQVNDISPEPSILRGKSVPAIVKIPAVDKEEIEKTLTKTALLPAEVRERINLPPRAVASGAGKLWYVLVGLAAVVVVLLGVIAFLLVRSSSYKGVGTGQSQQQASNSESLAAQNLLSAPNQPAAPVQKIEIANTAPAVYGGQKINIEKSGQLPAAISFKSFVYSAETGKELSLTGACQDKYYAVVIFSSKDDYRKNPELAKFNSAFLCPPNKTFLADINLQKFNLPSGNYYLFVADQGETGPWYNPR